MFEVQDLRFATPATVSRCGMIWFSEDVLSVEMIFENFLTRMRHTPIDDSEDLRFGRPTGAAASKEDALSPEMQVGWCFPLSCCSTQHVSPSPSLPLYIVPARFRGTVLTSLPSSLLPVDWS